MDHVPKIVPARLRRASATPSESHPDADLLTAFAEQSLKDSERGQVLEHLARCGECRDVVVLALPVSDVEAQPKAAAGARSWSMREWLVWPALRWGVVAAGIALAASAGMLEYQHRTQQNAALISVPVWQEQSTVSPQMQTPQPDFGGARAASAGHRSPAKRSPGTGPGLHESAKAQAAPANAGRNQIQSPLAQNQSQQLAQNEPVDHFDVVKAKALMAPQAGVTSTPRWSISSTGALQRSFDGGMTWQSVNIAFSAVNDAPAATPAEKMGTHESANPVIVFHAVTTLGPEVWAGGNAALLYHSFDSGDHWMQVSPLDANVSPSGDIFTVEFSDQQHGKFTTSAGELWTTSDDGQSWQRQQ